MGARLLVGRGCGGTYDLTPPAPATYTAVFRHAAVYVRPKGATPLRESLVPAYTECAVPNRVHGPPLASGSCAPPGQTSARLTVGTQDANGEAAQSVGSVRYAVVVGDPLTEQNEADVRVTFSITDVREAIGLADYEGELQLNPVLRITDRHNGPSGTEGATTEDTPSR